MNYMNYAEAIGNWIKNWKKLTIANKTASPEVQSYSSDNNYNSNYQPTQEEENNVDPTDQHLKSIPLISAQENYTGRKVIRQTEGMNIADSESKRLLLNSEYLNNS